MTNNLAVHRMMLVDPKLNPADPVCGYFRYPTEAGYRRVALWLEEGQLVATDNGEVVDGFDVWRRPFKAAVPYESFLHHEQRGYFPDEQPPRDHNNPPESVETESATNQQPVDDAVYLDICAQTDRVLAEAGLVVDVEGVNADPDTAGNLVAVLLALAKKGEDEHDSEKDYWLKGARQIDDRWSFTKTLRQAAKDIRDKVITPILAARKREADRLRREAEQALAKQAQAVKEGGPIPPVPPMPKEPSLAFGGAAGGRKVKLKEVEVAEVVDPLAFCAHLIGQGNADLLELLARLAKLALRAKVKGLPGVNYKMEERA